MLTIGVISILAISTLLLLLLPVVNRTRMHAGELEKTVIEKSTALESELAVRNKAEEELRRSQKLLAEAEKIAHFGSWEWDMLTNKMTWSDELFRIYGIPKREFEDVADALLSRVHPDDRERVRQTTTSAIESCSPVEYYKRIIRPDGTVRTLHVRGDIVMEKGRPVRVYGACQDVTELKEAEESLARLAAIVASSDDAIVGQTVNGTIVSWNKGAERIFGYAPDEIEERSVLLLIPSDRPGEAAEELSAIKRGDREEHVETVRIRKGGLPIHVSLSRYPVKNESGAVIGATTIARDITEQKKALDLIKRQTMELEQANRRLLELDRLKSEFVSNVSHELRTPIAAVKGAAANMMFGFLGPVTDDQKEALDIIKRNVDRLRRLIENLLDLSRIESGAFHLDLKTMDLRVPVKWAVNGVSTIAKEKGIALNFDMPDDPIEISVDEDRIVQVVTNIVGNALRFAAKEIRIALFSDGTSACIIVEDDGPGIPEEEISLIFERFHQVKKHMGRHGTGLGLSIVQGIVTAHGGRIWAENRPAHDGTGARFTVVLPLVAPDFVKEQNGEHSLETVLR